MQINVLIEDDSGNVIEKRVYAGDTSNVQALLAKEGKPYEIYDDVQGTAFDDAKLAPTKNQTDWQAAKNKGTDAALDFIAKTLGLE